MTATLNYILEANIGLLLTLAFYFLFLRGETRFRLMRIYLLTSILASLLFPLIDIGVNQETAPLSISRIIPSYWLPEVVVGGESAAEVHGASINFWKYTTQIYAMGLILCSLFVLFQLFQLFRIIAYSKTYRLRTLRIAESPENKPTFSFFNFIFIGKADALTSEEKKQIILHESVHAQQWHSFDILLINLMKILFWFNPLINVYKKIFIQLHEFEADARAVENGDLNKYCSLLARVALQSADFKLANHFNNSLTVKRIEMMRTIKTNIKKWKLVALSTVIPLVFLFTACQDQVGEDLMEITKNSSYALIVPAEIQARYEQIKKENPDKNYALLELNETATQKLEKLEATYGLPSHIEVFNTSRGEGAHPNQKQLELLSTTAESKYSEIKLDKRESGMKGQTFAIIEFNEQASRISDAASAEEKVFTVVEEQPEFTGGYDAMMSFIRDNLRYPSEARQQGIEGTVYTSFIVEVDGSISSIKSIRGISPDCDAEVRRVIGLMPNWIPGKQNKQYVRVRFVLPIKFKL